MEYNSSHLKTQARWTPKAGVLFYCTHTNTCMCIYVSWLHEKCLEDIQNASPRTSGLLRHLYLGSAASTWAELQCIWSWARLFCDARCPSYDLVLDQTGKRAVGGAKDSVFSTCVFLVLLSCYGGIHTWLLLQSMAKKCWSVTDGGWKLILFVCIKDLFIIQTSQHPVNEGSNYLFNFWLGWYKRRLEAWEEHIFLSLNNQWSSSHKHISLLLAVNHNDKIHDCLVLHFSSIGLKLTREHICAE